MQAAAAAAVRHGVHPYARPAAPAAAMVARPAAPAGVAVAARPAAPAGVAVAAVAARAPPPARMVQQRPLLPAAAGAAVSLAAAQQQRLHQLQQLQQARAAAAGALGARGAAVGARGAGAGRGAGGRGAGGRGVAVGAPPGGVPTPATAAAAARAAAVDTAAVAAPLSAAAAAEKLAAMRAPVEAVAKLHGLAAGSCPDLAFFATSFPLAIGRGAAHALPWASGAHCMVDADPSISRVHATLAFEPSSRTYELSVLGRAGATVDGHRLQKGAVVRVGNGSCVRIGRAEFCVLMPARLPNPPPPTATLTLPALAGAGTSAEPALPLAALAEHALASAPAGRLSLGEVALWLRRCFPAYAARPVAQLCGELRDALEGRGAVTEHAARGEKEANSGAVWARINPSPPVAAAAVQ